MATPPKKSSETTVIPPNSVPATPPKKSSETTVIPPNSVPAAAPQNPLATVVNSLNFDPSQDTYKITGAGGIATINVKKPTGEVYSAHVNGVAFKQFTVFDPASVSVDERRNLEYDLVKRKGLTQSEAGNLLGVPQSLVSKDIKIVEASKSNSKKK